MHFPRQQTLEATIAWSYALLDQAEQLLFERLTVFVGGWTVEAAEQVCADPDDTDAPVRIRDSDVVDLLARLVAKSMAVATPDGHGAMRYRMLETLRQYGRDRLVERADADTVSDRHARYFLVWAQRHLSPSDTSIPLRDTSVELDNLRVALRWLLDERDTTRAVQLGAALRWYWFQRGRLDEGFRWFSEIISLPGLNPETEEVAHVLAAAALIAGRQQRFAEAERLHTRALALWRSVGNDYEIARSLSQLGSLFRHTGRPAESYPCFEEGATLSEQRGFRVIEGLNRIGLAETLYDDARYEDALAAAGRALEIVAALDYALAMSWAKRAIGLIHYQLGKRSAARQFLEESLTEARREQARGWWLADALGCVAQLDVDGRRFERAGTLLREALHESMALGDQRMIARCLERISYLAAVQGLSKRAVRLAGAADSLRTVAGLPRSPVESRTVRGWLAPAEQGLQPAVREQLRRECAGMPLEQVVAYALDASERNAVLARADSASSEAAAPSQLSRREHEVALLVARGLSNPRIAVQLIIGERTVQSHVSNILQKLGLSSRVQVAGWVAKHYGAGVGQHHP